MIAGPQRRTRVMKDKEKLITAYHEGGHALAAAAMRHTDPVTKITILPRGRALGYTMVLPLEDKYSVTRNELLDQLAYAMGGRVAEEIVFHDPTTGASNDIEKATAHRPQDGHRVRHERRASAPSSSAPVVGRGVPRPRHGPPARLLRAASPSGSTPRCARSSRRRTTRRGRCSTTNRDILDRLATRAAREGDARPQRARRDLQGREEAAASARSGSRATSVPSRDLPADRLPGQGTDRRRRRRRRRRLGPPSRSAKRAPRIKPRPATA